MKNISKKNLKFSFFSFDLYTYIVLKHLNKIKIYRYDFFSFFVFPFFSRVFPFCFPVVFPRCSTPGGWVEVLGPVFPLTRARVRGKTTCTGRSPRARVEVLEPGSKSSSQTLSLIFHCFCNVFIKLCFPFVFHHLSLN